MFLEQLTSFHTKRICNVFKVHPLLMHFVFLFTTKLGYASFIVAFVELINMQVKP